MKTIVCSIILFIFLFLPPQNVAGQETYFPERNEVWKKATEKQFTYNQKKLQVAVDFALDNEYSGSRVYVRPF